MPVASNDVVPRLADIATRFADIHSELKDIAQLPFGVHRHKLVPLVELMALIDQTQTLSEYAEALGDTITAIRALNVALPVNPLYVTRADGVVDERRWFDDQPNESQPGDHPPQRTGAMPRTAYGAPATGSGEADATYPPQRARGIERGAP